MTTKQEPYRYGCGAYVLIIALFLLFAFGCSPRFYQYKAVMTPKGLKRTSDIREYVPSNSDTIIVIYRKR